MRVLGVVAAAVMGIACASTGAGTGSSSGSGSGGTCLPIAAMQLLVQHGDEWEPVAWFDDQGVFSQNVSRRATGPAARLVADQVLDLKGNVQLSCDGNRVLHQTGSPFTMRFDGSDALGDAHDRIYVSDDGTVGASWDKKGAGPAPWKVTARMPEQRRTAELLVLMAMMSADWEFN